MQKKRWLQGAFALAITTAAVGFAIAADHLDGAEVKKDPASDITDVYAWTTADKLVLVMNVSPLATAQSKFSDAVQYALHVETSSGYGMPGEKTDIVCTFDAAQAVFCQMGTPNALISDTVKGDASGSSGITSDAGKMKVFTGLRADPFYFNLDGFKDAVATVKGLASKLTFDGSGCPTVDAANSGVLIGQLQGTKMGTSPAENFFGAANVLSIVVEIDKASVMAGGNILAVWASTHQGG